MNKWIFRSTILGHTQIHYFTGLAQSQAIPEFSHFHEEALTLHDQLYGNFAKALAGGGLAGIFTIVSTCHFVEPQPALVELNAVSISRCGTETGSSSLITVWGESTHEAEYIADSLWFTVINQKKHIQFSCALLFMCVHKIGHYKRLQQLRKAL